MSNALPTVTPAYTTPTRPWPVDEWEIAPSLEHRELAAVVDEVFSDEALGQTYAALVIQHGRIVAERYAGFIEHFDRDPEPVTSETPLLSWSMAKSILHGLIGTLVAEGRFDPNQRPGFAEWTESDPRAAIRVSDLLAMRDGLGFVEVYELGQISHVVEMLFGEGKEDMAAYVASLPLAHAPDSVFNYSSGTTNLLSRVVAHELGRGSEFDAALHARLLDPLGMHSARATYDPTGLWIASSYLHATARDFAKFGLLYLHGGRIGDRQLIPESWCDTAQVPLSQDEESGRYYSWQWWVTGDPYGTYWASGYEGQMISVVPGLDALVLRFGKTSHEHYDELFAWRRRVLDVLAQR